VSSRTAFALALLSVSCESESRSIQPPTVERISTSVPAMPRSPELTRSPVSPSAHTHAIISVAVSLDGRTLATGSECDPTTEDVMAPHVGVVLWDIETGAARAAIPVVGGVGLGDQLRRGLRFSADGALLGFDFNTNQVGVLEVSSGRIVLEAPPSGGDNASSFAVSDDGSEIFVGVAEACPDGAGSVVSSRAGLHPQVRCLTFPGALSYSEALSFRGGIAHVVNGEQLLSLDAAGRRPARAIPLLGGSCAGLDAHYTIDPSPSGRFVAVSAADPRCGQPALIGSALIDMDSGERVFEDSSLTNVVSFEFAANESRWAALTANRLPGGPVSLVTVFDGARRLGTIAGPLEVNDWQRFADGTPFAFAPDGREAMIVRAGGVLERWRIDPQPARVGVLGTVQGATAVWWPRPEIAIAIGPRVLAFIDARSGRVTQRHAFPE
jgi:hypothetical protein